MPKRPRQKCGLVTTLVSGFIGLAYEGISSFLQRKWDNALKRAVLAMDKVKIPSHPYVLVDRVILCNCGLEADNHHLLKSLAACNNEHTKLKMYFTINLAFTNYLDEMSNLTGHPSLDRSITKYEQIFPIHLNISSTNFDSSLYSRPSRLKDFVHGYMQDNT